MEKTQTLSDEIIGNQSGMEIPKVLESTKYLFIVDVKKHLQEFKEELKEEFKRNWDIDFKDSILKQLTSHDEFCFKECDCSKIICDFLNTQMQKHFGDKLI